MADQTYQVTAAFLETSMYAFQQMQVNLGITIQTLKTHNDVDRLHIYEDALAKCEAALDFIGSQIGAQ